MIGLAGGGLEAAVSSIWKRHLTTAGTVPAHLEYRVPTADGRRLAVAEWGAPDGWPLIAIHGGPGSRISYWADEPAIYERFGVRRITFDRPGYGRSTRKPGRTVADAATDVATIADALGIDWFALTGRSYGGPHALACAALLPDRVRRCLAVVPVAPFDAEGLEFMAGMNEGNIREFTTTLTGEGPLRALLGPQRATTIARLRAGRADYLGDAYTMSEADVERMRRDTQSAADQILAGLAPGPDGLIDDNLALVRPWGFDLGAIHVPVVIAYGRHDTLVPPAHSEWLAAHIAGSITWVDPGSGHVASASHMERDLAWLAG
jgi:pimeloyl-ACP methyl ester carboxylesterase